MASQKNFAITPSVSVSRSKFRRPSQWKGTFKLGQIVPIYVDCDILPGDTVSMDLAALVRMSTPYAPLMDNIFIDYYAFYCPHRIVYDDWKQFMGENTTSYGAATEPLYPTTSISAANHYCVNGSIGDMMGLPYLPVATTNACRVSSIPGRVYFTIYNEWMRDQNLIAPYAVVKSSGAAFLATDPVTSTQLGYEAMPLLAAKESDYFTRSLPYAQKGNPVKLPLGDSAPILYQQPVGSLAADSVVKLQTTSAISPTSNVSSLDGNSGSGTSATGVVYADLSQATASTINQLRFAFQYQKFLEKDALYGSRYWEILKGHFGITAPDASLQRPELLGHFRQHINIDQVLQTSESGTTALGTPGANSVSGKSDHIISKSFVEHGTIMILAVARHDLTYSKGINRMWSRTKRTDFYFPVFANLGAQVVKNKEIYAQATSADDLPFGYQEAWAEYRYKPSIVTGDLNPERTNSMSFWTLAERFGSLPTLSKSFIEQDRTAISDSLVTGAGGPDFLADFYFDAVYVRPMPMYSIPGLIDHH